MIPYVKGSETSKAAAESIRQQAVSDKVKVYRFLMACGNYGATDDEVRAALDMPIASTAAARRRSLELIGACERTEIKRKTRSGRMAFVYRAVPNADLQVTPGRPAKAIDARRHAKVTTYVTQEMHADLCYLAAESDRSVADIVRAALQVYISEHAS